MAICSVSAYPSADKAVAASKMLGNFAVILQGMSNACPIDVAPCTESPSAAGRHPNQNILQFSNGLRAPVKDLKVQPRP